MADQKAKTTKTKVFRKNYFLAGFGPVGKGSKVLPEHKKASNFSEKLTD